MLIISKNVFPRLGGSVFFSKHPRARAGSSISHGYMCRLFAKYDEASPHTYFVRLRMNYAAHLLSTSDATLGVLAEQLSFSDAYAFSKSFKRVMGVAPGTYRRASELPGGRYRRTCSRRAVSDWKGGPKGEG